MEKNLNIALCGASGYIGSNLRKALEIAGHIVTPIGHKLLQNSTLSELTKTIQNCDTVINLAGAPISRRWTKSYKIELQNSRINVTKRLVDVITATNNVTTFINASAIGIYPPIGCHSEYSSATGSDFLASLCKAWENEALKIPDRVRTIVTRFGIVLSPDAPTFRKLILPNKFKVSVLISSGMQPFSWIALEDLIRAIIFLCQTPSESGIYNLTAPQKITIAQTTKILADHYKTWINIRIPSTIIRVALGEGADVLLSGQCAPPTRLLEAGFEFQAPDLLTFLEKTNTFVNTNENAPHNPPNGNHAERL